MTNLLLLYDTEEQDLARDFYDLLKEIGIDNVELIPLSSDKGLSLDEKEKNYFENAAGALFIITPGSKRNGLDYPSPSVTQEMEKAKQRFKKTPECVIYLVEKGCHAPSIDQKAYIPFKRDDIRLILLALVRLIRNLKSARFFKIDSLSMQRKSISKEELEVIIKNLNLQKKRALFDISNKPDGVISHGDLTKLLNEKYNLNIQDVNFFKREMLDANVIEKKFANIIGTIYILTDLGWDIIRIISEEIKKEDSKSLNDRIAEARRGKH